MHSSLHRYEELDSHQSSIWITQIDANAAYVFVFRIEAYDAAYSQTYR